MSNNSAKDLKVASWNVNIIGKYNLHKLIDVLKTLWQYDIDIAFLQETKLQHKFEEQYKHYTLHVPCSKNIAKENSHGVAVAVKNNLKCSCQIVLIKGYELSSDRIMYCIIQTETNKIHFINVYAPASKSKSQITVETFYDHLRDIYSHVPEHELVFLLGDFNAHIGPDDDHEEGFYVNKKSNDKGTEMKNFCKDNNLVIVNVTIGKENIEKFSRCGKKNWSEIDFFLTRRNDDLVLPVKDLDIYSTLGISDHCIVVATLKIEIEIQEPSTPDMDIDVSEFVNYLTNYLTNKQPKVDILEVRNNWDDLKLYIDELYGFPHNVSNTLFELTNTFKKVRGGKYYTFPINTLSLIETCLVSLKKTEVGCTPGEIDQIIDALGKIDFKNNLDNVNENGNEFEEEVTTLPSLEEVKELMLEIEETKKYTFLSNHIHSLVTAIWKKGHVPIELTMCKAGVFRTKEQNWINVVKLIYTVIQNIVISRLKLQAYSMIKFYDYEEDDEEDKDLVRTRINNLEFDNKIVISDLLSFLTSHGLPLQMGSLISYFTFEKTGKLFQLIYECLLIISISILSKNIIAYWKKNHFVYWKTELVMYTNKMFLVSYSQNELNSLEKIILDTLFEFKKN